MRFATLEITGFGGVSERLRVDLSADVTILSGVNGSGKTTIFDAIAWALTGLHPRDADPRNLFSFSGETRVVLGLVDLDGAEWTAVRTVVDSTVKIQDLATSLLIRTADGQSLVGAQAQDWLAHTLISGTIDDNAADPSRTALYSYYLQQESLREFLGSRTDDERFSVLSTLVGASRLSTLVRQFEASKNSWVRAANKARPAIDLARQRLAIAQQTRARLNDQAALAAAVATDPRLLSWMTATANLLGAQLKQSDTSVSVEQIGERMRDIRNQADLTAQTLSDLDLLLDNLVQPIPAVDADAIAAARLEHSNTVERVADRQASLARTISVLSAVQDEVQRRRDQAAELGSMAELAIRHVGENCPACGQNVDPKALTERLTRLIRNGSDESEGPALIAAVAARAAAQQELDAALAGEARALEAVRRLERAADRARSQLRRVSDSIERLAQRVELDLGSTNGLSLASAEARDRIASLARNARDEVSQRLFALQDALASGEPLRLTASAANAQGRAETAARAVESARAELAQVELEQALRDETSDRADRLLKFLRAEAEQYVNTRLHDIQPLLNQIYSAIDPHPAFKAVSLTTRQHYGKNRLDPVIRDQLFDVESSDPGRVMSTSQANALAVALFLAFNLGLSPTSLQVIALDDPLQNLDDLHLLGLVDLLRRVAPHRQILISTHDRAFSRLLERKLRPVNSSSRARVIAIEAWSRNGPSIVATDVTEDVQPLKLTSQ